MVEGISVYTYMHLSARFKHMYEMQNSYLYMVRHEQMLVPLVKFDGL